MSFVARFYHIQILDGFALFFIPSKILGISKNYSQSRYLVFRYALVLLENYCNTEQDHCPQFDDFFLRHPFEVSAWE